MLDYLGMEKLLRQNGLKATPGRLAMLKFLSQKGKPQTAETIYKGLKEQFDLVTIYRNLEKFRQKNLVFKESLAKKDFYYMDQSPHHHIVCENCETMECVPCSHQKFTIKNFTNIKHQLLLTGICRQCAKI